MGRWTYVVLGGIIAVFFALVAVVLVFLENRKHRGK